jgi:hypothetical protein
MQGCRLLQTHSQAGQTDRHLRLELIPRNTDGSADTRRLGDLGASEAVHVHVEQRVHVWGFGGLSGRGRRNCARAAVTLGQSGVAHHSSIHLTCT